MIESPSTAIPAPPPINNTRAALWMLGSAISFSILSFALKVLTAHLPVMEVAFLRCVMSLAILVPIVLHQGWGVFRTSRVDLQITRVLCATGGVLLGIFGLSQLHLATAVCLSFTRPLFMIVLAHFLLNEKVHWRRGVATVVGFIGVMIVVGPSDFSDIMGCLATLASAAFVAGSLAVVRQQAGTDGPGTIMAWYAVGTCLTTFLPAAFVWQWPTSADIVPLVIVALLGSTGQYMLVRAFAEGEATVVNPIDYSQLIIATFIGYVMFGELPTAWMAAGSVVIIGSTLYILFREAKIRQPTAFPTPPDP
jgi:drug/metabolite transporter (DMT)-like permease